jgi:hypothetical protein
MKVGKKSKKRNPSWLPTGTCHKKSGNLEIFFPLKSGKFGPFFSVKNH